MIPSVTLKPGKDVSILRGHPWIYSGAIASYPAEGFRDGGIYGVLAHDKTFLGSAYFNRRCGFISGRMVAFGKIDPLEAVKKSLLEAYKLRSTILDFAHTNAYRLANGEADGLPGLIIDMYADVAVLQVSTLGMEQLKPFILEILAEFVAPKSVYEKSDMPSRREEGLEPFSGLIQWEEVSEVVVLENDVKFIVDIKMGQKTGLFLDQREMRALVGKYARGRRLLNAFCYTGWFSLYAAMQGATRVDSLDISGSCVETARRNFEINGIPLEKHGFLKADAFDFLRSDTLDYDFIILDPPAFAKKKADIDHARKGYREINRQALTKMPRGSLLLTCSCSYYIDETMFRDIILAAAVDARRRVRILSHHVLAADHPVSLVHTEGHYLKSFLLYVE